FEFLARVLDSILRFGGEANEDLPFAALRDLGRDVSGRFEIQTERALALDLVFARLFHAIVRDGSGLNDDGRVRKFAQHSFAHLLGGFDADRVNPVRIVQSDRAADEDDVGAHALGLLGKRKPHLATGAIADEADRIDRLTSRTGRNEHSLTGELTG